jgi:ABC-type sugar transport system substrate-binding protein
MRQSADQSATSASPGAKPESVAALAPFDPAHAPGARPPVPRCIAQALPWRAVTQLGWAGGMTSAAAQRDVSLEVAFADADAATQQGQIEAWPDEGIGGIDFESIDIDAVRPLKQHALDAGVAVVGTASGPNIMRLTLDFYAMGKALGDHAPDWIRARLDGKEKVVHYAHGQFGPVLRDRGARDAVSGAGGGMEFVEYAARTEEDTTDGSQALTARLLEEHPDVDVRLGPDRMMPGAHAALEDAGALTDRTFIRGDRRAGRAARQHQLRHPRPIHRRGFLSQ